MEKRKDIDMLRFYGGDIHQKNKEGEYVITNNLVNPKNKEDMLWGDRDAYRTLNALLFEGIENEKERIYKEKRKLNPVFIELIENTLEIYRGIFAVMCRKKGNQLSVSKIKRVDRKASLMAYLKGYTESFVSCTKGEYDDEFAAKNNIILLEIESLENIPYVDYQQVVTMQEYRNYDEKEVLFPPFLSLKVSEIELTTKDNHIKDMYGKLQLEMDVKEQDVEEFIRRITRAKYDVDGLLLNEESQGLGFSNLIYLHMRLEEFYKSIDKNKVNVFFIEEPESHMHPQMQNVFIRFLKNYYIDKKLQGLITTHSNEIARMVGLDSLRVIRQTEKSRSELFDLSKFRNSIKKEKIENLDDESEFLLANFFDWFFEIGYSELIFADKVILYEGDSERLYIRKLIKLPEFLPLNDSYIAFIQVGGAYAHNYLPILRMLKMKTLIITDLDYDKKNLSMEEVKAKDSNSTNATINYCYRVAHPDREEKYVPTIKELYDFQVEGKNILYNGLVYLAFQDENSTARTLEEAMLKKILKVDVFHASYIYTA